jgi:hypothetical protein
MNELITVPSVDPIEPSSPLIDFNDPATKELSLSFITWTVLTRRSQLLDTSMRSLLDEINESNKEIAEHNYYMRKYGQAKTAGAIHDPRKGFLIPKDEIKREKLIKDPYSADGSYFDKNDQYYYDWNREKGAPDKSRPNPLSDMLDDNNKAIAQEAIESHKGKVEKISNIQQLQMAKLQDVMGKRNEMSQLLSTMLKAFFEQNMAPIQKM